MSTAGITPVVVGFVLHLSREGASGFWPSEATPEQPRRVRECTSRGVRMRIVRPFGRVRCKFDALEATSEQPRRVLESRLSWRLKRAGLSFGRVRCNFGVSEATRV